VRTNEDIAQHLEHSPGPWKIAGYAGPREETGALIVDALGQEVALTATVHGPVSAGEPMDWKRYYLNARLIAAAPEMLLALEQLVGGCDPKTSIEDRGRQAAVDSARAIIAKARGRE